MTTAFVGLGRMGAAIAAAAVKAGHEVRLYDPSPEAVAEVTAVGDAVVCASAAEAARGCDGVILTVNSDQQVVDALTGPAGVLAGAAPGTAVAVHSTISHTTLRSVAEAGDAVGVSVVDAGISGHHGHWSIPELAVMCGGDPAAVDRLRPVMASYASLVSHLGPLGSGLDAKLALNVLRYFTMLTHKESRRLATAAGLGPEWEQILTHVHATDFFNPDPGTPLTDETLDRRLVNAEIARKDLSAAVDRGLELGTTLPVTETMQTVVGHIWGVP